MHGRRHGGKRGCLLAGADVPWRGAQTWVLRSLLTIPGVSPKRKSFPWCLGSSAPHGVVLAQDQALARVGWFSCWGQQGLGPVGAHQKGMSTLGYHERCELLGTGPRGHLGFCPQPGFLLAPFPIPLLLAASQDPPHSLPSFPPHLHGVLLTPWPPHSMLGARQWIFLGFSPRMLPSMSAKG